MSPLTPALVQDLAHNDVLVAHVIDPLIPSESAKTLEYCWDTRRKTDDVPKTTTGLMECMDWHAGVSYGPRLWLCTVILSTGLKSCMLPCRHGMEPNITLIWFVQPQWFQKMGAFARRENIPVFVEWCETAFKLFGEITYQLMYHHTPAASCGLGT